MSLRKDKSSEKNKAFMGLALELANQNKGLTGLNPSVGCVVTLSLIHISEPTRP